MTNFVEIHEWYIEVWHFAITNLQCRQPDKKEVQLPYPRRYFVYDLYRQEVKQPASRPYFFEVIH
jgi:hypothetical protein